MSDYLLGDWYWVRLHNIGSDDWEAAKVVTDGGIRKFETRRAFYGLIDHRMTVGPKAVLPAEEETGPEPDWNREDELEYDILLASRADTLLKYVKRAIAEGWEPLGAAGHTTTTWHQTMVRRSAK